MVLTDDQVERVFAAYIGLMVLRTMCKKAGLTLGQKQSEEVLRDLEAIFPEFPARSCLR